MDRIAELLEIQVGMLASLQGHLAEANAHLGAIAEVLIEMSEEEECEEEGEYEDDEEEDEEVPEDAAYVCPKCALADDAALNSCG